MIIIVEGPDGAGKSSLVETLVEQTGCKAMHFNKPQTEEDFMLMYGYYFQLVKNKTSLILDRSWYSELVYGPIMRGRSVISYNQMYILESAIAQYGGMIIHCNDTPAKLWERCKKRGESYITSKEELINIHTEYGKLFNSVPHLIPVVTRTVPRLKSV